MHDALLLFLSLEIDELTVNHLLVRELNNIIEIEYVRPLFGGRVGAVTIE